MLIFSIAKRQADINNNNNKLFQHSGCGNFKRGSILGNEYFPFENKKKI